MMKQYQKPPKPPKPQTDVEGEGETSDGRSDGGRDGQTTVPIWMLIASSSILLSVVVMHTTAIAFSETYEKSIMHSPTWLIAIVRMLFASLALLVVTISFFTRCQTDPLFVGAASMVYVGCLLEPYGQGLWIAKS